MDGTVENIRRLGQIRDLSFRHGVTESRIRQLLDADIGALDETHRFSRLEKALNVAGSAAWRHRVDNAHGAEALFDHEFRFRAVSRAGRTVTSVQGEQVALPRSAFIGVRHCELIPSKTSYLGDGQEGFEGLRDRGFFEGRMLGIQIALEMNFGFHFLDCIMEIWAIQTPDTGIWAHSQLHPTGATVPTIKAPGVKVRSVQYF
jgi:hypothetical protein